MEFVERECLLFEAGEYPDKGVTISEDDLKAIAWNSEAAVPMRIEHLARSPFDGALGVVTRLRANGGQLWGTLRQTKTAWEMVRQAGARALSVGLDVEGRRIVETSFVCQPRVANAQIFGDTGVVVFEANLPEEKGGEGTMTSVRQFAEGLMAYLRGVAGSGEESGDALNPGSAVSEFAAEREHLARERAAMRAERADQRILEWKRQGRLRASEPVETLARTLLLNGEGVTTFDGASVPLNALFERFVNENGPVVPMGERMATDGSGTGESAGERLVALAKEKARQEGLSFVQSFAAVSAAHPDLASAAREA